MVQNGAETVTGILRILQRQFYGFGDRHTQAARIVGIFGQGGTSGGRNFARRGIHVCAPGVHHQFAVGFLVVADFHHKDLQVDAEMLRGHRHGGSPLSGTGFGGQVADALFVVVVSLRNRGVGLV